MNKILLAATILLSSVVFAQAQVSKGYYSIYKNNEKLNKQTQATTIVGDGHALDEQIATKGYYTIGENFKNVYKSTTSFNTESKSITAAKGYYSIDKTATKTNNGNSVITNSGNSVSNSAVGVGH